MPITKWSIIKKRGKTLCFCRFFTYQCKTIEHWNTITPVPQNYQKKVPKIHIFSKKKYEFRVCMLKYKFWPILDGFLPPFWPSCRVSKAYKTVLNLPKTILSPTVAQKYLHHSPTHRNNKKKPKNGPPKSRGRRHETLCVGLGANVEFSKNLVWDPVFLHFFQNRPTWGPWKGDLGVSSMTSLMSCLTLYMAIYYVWL